MRNYQNKSNAGALPDSITTTKFGAGEFNSIATELENAVSTSDQTLAPADGTGEVNVQLAMALAIYGAGGAAYHLDNGAVNAYVLTPVSPKESPNALFNGFSVVFEPGTVNTMASTVNVASLGVKPITLQNGSALTGGELSGTCCLKFNLGDDRFELIYNSDIVTNLYLPAIQISDLLGRYGTFNGQQITLSGFYEEGDGGGGLFFWDENQDQSNHDGGTIIDPDHTNNVGASGWYVSENASLGCWVRIIINSTISAKAFGYLADYDESTGLGTENGEILEYALAAVNIVICPDGMAKVDSLDVPVGKTVCGVGYEFETFFSSVGTPDPSTITGTVWCSRKAAVMSSGRPTNELVRLNRDCHIKDLLIYWDNQGDPTGGGWTPTDTPWAIRSGRFTDTSRIDRAERSSIDNVCVMAFSHGVEFQRGGEGGHISKLKMSVFDIGLSIDGVHHIIDLNEIDCYPYWSVDSNVTDYTIDNLIAYEFGRVDGLKVNAGLFAIYATKTVDFIPSRSPDFTNQGAYHFAIDKIYSDGCLHAMYVESGITPTPVTGTIDQLISHRVSSATSVGAGNDYGIYIDGFAQIDIFHLQSGGASFQRLGGHAKVDEANSILRISQARISEWDTGTAGYYGFYAVTSTSKIIIETPVQMYTSTGGWLSPTPSIFKGFSTDENNIFTHQMYYLDCMTDSISSKAVTINTTDQTVSTTKRIAPLGFGFRQFRTICIIAGHGTATTFTVKSQSNLAITANVTTAGSGSTETLIGSWNNIGTYNPTNEVNIDHVLVNGTPGVASLTFYQLGIEFR